MINIESFKLPIEYVEHKETSETIKDDLELVEFKNKDASYNYASLYESIFEPSNIFSKATSNQWCKYYTTDISFLIQTQKLIKNYKHLDYSYNETKFKDIYSIYNDVTTDNNFLDKYQYIDISCLKRFNNSEQILQSLSILNLTSPLLSILIPIILLIMPLFIFKLYGLNLSISTYLFILKQIFTKHPIGNICMNFSSAPLDKKIYLTFSLVFYLFQMIQSIRSCYKFYKNLELMHNNLNELHRYFEYTLYSFDEFKQQAEGYNSYDSFVIQLNENREILDEYKSKINQICPCKFGIRKIFNIGKAMKLFYTFNNNDELKRAMMYSFGFHGFIYNLNTLNIKIVNKEISLCKYSKSKTKFKQAYYPIIKDKIVKNSYDLNKKILITGPNASGKTTILKTTLLNILFSQQIGMGFYSNAKIKPYSYLYSYLNIPDTSCRDSLFQAEARRCKDIILQLENSNKNENHFCIFDELYSGTNPYEAISSSISLLKYINKHSNIDYILTTHFLDVCKNLDNDKNIINCYMNIIIDKDDFKYTYKLLNGISQIKGGVKVLKDLEYPDEIINNAKELLNSLII
jgi:energy-coupling factor transporter ATP-binding protein EcfA2